MTVDDASSNPWWATFFASRDRIGWWLAHADPPGDDVGVLTRRILRFATSLADPGPTRGRLVVGVTHSPLLRAVLLHASGTDPGEPGYVTGADIRVHPDQRAVSIHPYDPLAD
jgi:broad specificity phosphatase PhoE